MLIHCLHFLPLKTMLRIAEAVYEHLCIVYTILYKRINALILH